MGRQDRSMLGDFALLIPPREGKDEMGSYQTEE